MGTLLLHSLFFAAAMWGGAGTSQFPDRPDAIGAGANSGNRDGYSSERSTTVRLLSEVDAQRSPSPAEALMSEIIHTSAKLKVTGPDSLPLPPLLFEEGGAPTVPRDAELLARTKLVGIYESQIRARIERAWTLPAEYRDTAQALSARRLPYVRRHRVD